MSGDDGYGVITCGHGVVVSAYVLLLGDKEWLFFVMG